MINYVAKKDFRIGEIDKEIRQNETIQYDLDTGKLVFKGLEYMAPNLKSAIRAMWLVPVVPTVINLEGIGESPEQILDKKRKQRFADMDKTNTLETDSRQVGGIFPESTKIYKESLGLTSVNEKSKFKTVVQTEDSRIVSNIDMKKDLELQNIKETMKRDGNNFKKQAGSFEVFSDHFDAKVIPLNSSNNKLTESEKEIIKQWATTHWGKKSNLLTKLSKIALEELLKVETSEKILKRIQEQIEKR